MGRGSFQFLSSLLTRIPAGTEGALAAPGETKQAAAFSEGCPATLQGVCAHLAFVQSLPANVHVVIGHQDVCVIAQRTQELSAFEPSVAIDCVAFRVRCTFGVVGADAAAAGGVQH